MDPQLWLNELRTELHSRRLPRRYVTRLMRELSDHVTDDWENSMNKDVQVRPGSMERLGSPRDVAESAEREFRLRKFATRHPVWTFGILPPFLVLVLAIAFFIGPGILLELSDATWVDEYGSSSWVPLLARSYIVGCILLSAVLVVTALTGLAKRCGLARRWPMTAAIVTALLCGCLWTKATAKTPEQREMLMVGISASLRPAGITFPQVLQFAAPLLVAAWASRALPSAPGTLPETRTAA